jgi:hypothetical protein
VLAGANLLSLFNQEMFMYTVVLVAGLQHADCAAFVGVAKHADDAMQIALHKYNADAGNTGADVLYAETLAQLQALPGMQQPAPWGAVQVHKG